MKTSLPGKIEEWIRELNSVDLSDFKNYDIELKKTVKKIIKEVRKDYLWESDGETRNYAKNRAPSVNVYVKDERSIS